MLVRIASLIRCESLFGPVFLVAQADNLHRMQEAQAVDGLDGEGLVALHCSNECLSSTDWFSVGAILVPVFRTREKPVCRRKRSCVFWSAGPRRR